MYSEQAIPRCAYVVTRCPYVATSSLPFVFCHKGPCCLQPCTTAVWPVVLIKHVVNVFFLNNIPPAPFKKMEFDASQGPQGNTGTHQTLKETSNNKFSDSLVIKCDDACATTCGVMNNKCSSERTSNWQLRQQKARRVAEGEGKLINWECWQQKCSVYMSLPAILSQKPVSSIFNSRKYCAVVPDTE